MSIFLYAFIKEQRIKLFDHWSVFIVIEKETFKSFEYWKNEESTKMKPQGVFSDRISLKNEIKSIKLVLNAQIQISNIF